MVLGRGLRKRRTCDRRDRRIACTASNPSVPQRDMVLISIESLNHYLHQSSLIIYSFAAGAEQDLVFVAEALQCFLGRRQVAIPERVEHCLRRLGSVDCLLALLLVEDTLDEVLHLSLPAHHARCALVALLDEPDWQTHYHGQQPGELTHLGPAFEPTHEWSPSTRA
jgi:hypothetical protein